MSVLDQDLVPISQVGQLVPSFRDEGVSASTLWRWSRVGVRGVRLRITRIGGRTFVAKQALEQFFESLSSPIEGPTDADS